MRNRRREWSLAGDAGLLKHLERFSENLTTKANETTEALDSLSNRLNETAIFVDNLTNTSLALANTQFIESRVQEDDVEIDKVTEQVEKGTTERELNPADIIAIVNESIKEGLRIIDEKYDKVDVVASDSEDEAENTLPSVILRPKDPYQDRPLPYVIGSDKWKTSVKIGLESSSSESEQMEEDEEEDSSSEAETKGIDLLNISHRQKTLHSQLSSASSESNDYNLDSNSTRGTNNGSLRAKSQDTLNIESEPLTPTSVLPKSQNINNGPPSFAEELAKRLGSVLPIQKNVITQEADNPSINRAKDDLFAQEDDEEDIFSNKSQNLFKEGGRSGGGGLFDDDIPPKWNKSIPKPVKTNMIPPSVDVPPPISSTSTKPKSAFDDLFGDAESDDSDDIFSTKSSKKNIFSNPKDAGNKKLVNSDFMDNIGSMTTSLSEADDNVKDLFADEEINEDDLFSTSKPQSHVDAPPVESSIRKKPVGGVSVLHGMDFRSSKLSTKIFRQSSSDSSGSESVNPESVTSKTNIEIPKNLPPNENLKDSRTSIQPANTSSAFDSSSGVDFQPPMTSTGLKSEELDRERVSSDNLFTTVKENKIPSNNDIFDDDDDDVFCPPPLPKANEKSSKSKVISLFDDSDTDDELFANSISKYNQSEKGVDLKKSESKEKPKTSKKISIFDDDDDDDDNEDNNDDIFAVKSSSNIFSVDKKVVDSGNEASTRKTSDLFTESRENDSSTKVKKVSELSKSIFYDSDEDDDLFGSILPKKGTKVTNIFENDGDDDNDSLKSSASNSEKNSKKGEKISINKGSDLSNIFQASKSGLFDDDMDDDDDLFGHKAPKDVDKIKSDDSAIKDKPEIVSKESKIDEKVSNSEGKKLPPVIPQKPDNLRTRTKEAEANKAENVVDGACISKSNPPNSLNIRPIADEAKEQPPRRVAVSGKIKNLMGRMGDLKILSPTDTPPVLRKNEEKTKDDDDESLEFDSEDGGSLSIPSSGKEASISADDLTRKNSDSILSEEINTEKAISFDEPVHIETLSNASKSRARIQVKRRPQSRQARQTALRQSGIDFDAIDSAQELNLSLAIDDKSERTFSKESTNKNTLLSPSTDEEDLFDVPPDLPEDPFKEDSLFGRAHILSPIDDLVTREIKSTKIDTATVIAENFHKEFIKKDIVEKETKIEEKHEKIVETKSKEESVSKNDSSSEEEIKKSPLDPLRNKDLDPLKDPSQLFAFVTKTPSPEKGKALLFHEDDSLFSSTSKKSNSTTKKVDLFHDDDDDDGDLFSVQSKNSKKLVKDTKMSLFDDEDNENDDLFGSLVKKEGNENKKVGSVEKNLFESDNEEHLFSDGTQATIPKDIVDDSKKKSNLNDIFGDQSSGEEDIFAFKKPISKKLTGERKSLFDDDTDDGDSDIFGKTSSSHSAAKKVVTRDLKKTAEQIIEDPLSALQED